MNKEIVKQLNNNHYDITSAIKFIKEHDGCDMGIRLCQKGYNTVVLSKEEILSEQFNLMDLQAWQYLSYNWEIVVPDDEKINKIEEIRDFMMYEVPGFELDTRFYDAHEMDIDQWFNVFNDWLDDEEVKYQIFMFLKDSKLLNKQLKP